MAHKGLQSHVPTPGQQGFIGPVRPSAPQPGQQGFIGPVRPPVSSTGTTPRNGKPIEQFTKEFDLEAALEAGRKASLITGIPFNPPTFTKPSETKPEIKPETKPEIEPEVDPEIKPEVTVEPEPPVTGTSDLERLKELQAEIAAGQPKPFFTFGPQEQGKLRTALEEEQASDAESVAILDAKLQIQEEMQKFTDELVGLPEAGRVGAVGEKGRELQRRLDVLNRRELVLEVKKRNRNNTINSLMQLGRQTFTDALAQYNTSWNQAMQIHNLIDREEDELQASGKVNLDVFTGALSEQIQSGQLVFEDISSSQWQRIREFELQAGIAEGLTAESLRAAQFEGKSIRSTIVSKDKSQATLIFDDGSTKKINTGFAPVDDVEIEIGGITVSDNTRAILQGFGSIQALTPSVAQQVNSDLQKLGFRNDTPPQWFVDLLQEEAQQTLSPDFLLQEWIEYTQAILAGDTTEEDKKEGLIDNPFK